MSAQSRPTPKLLPGDRDPVFLATDTIGDAWSWLILREAVLYGVTRFNAFQARLGISRETLSTCLDQLCSGGLLVLEGADYRLTPCGADMFGCLASAMQWGERWCADQGPTPLRLAHGRGGHRFSPVFRCACCNEPIRAREVAIDAVARASVELIVGHRHRAPNLDLLERESPCAIARTLHVCGDRWTSLVIRECFMGTRRFEAFGRHLGIAPNILTQRLNRLVQFGMLARLPYQERPTRYEYRLTEKGLDYYGMPLAMLTWAQRWLPRARRGIVLRHRICGERLTAILTCQRCAAPVRRDDVEIRQVAPAKGGAGL